MDKRGSVGTHRLSIGSVRSDTNEPVGLQKMPQVPSYYSHERDTQFDDYVARRSSLGGGPELERGTSGEYRRGSPPGDAAPDSLAVTGIVHSRARGASITRATSYTSDHVLVSVPEEEHETLDERSGQNSAKTSLLRSSRRNSDDNHIMGLSPVMQEVDIPEPKWLQK